MTREFSYKDKDDQIRRLGIIDCYKSHPLEASLQFALHLSIARRRNQWLIEIVMTGRGCRDGEGGVVERYDHSLFRNSLYLPMRPSHRKHSPWSRVSVDLLAWPTTWVVLFRHGRNLTCRCLTDVRNSTVSVVACCWVSLLLAAHFVWTIMPVEFKSSKT